MGTGRTATNQRAFDHSQSPGLAANRRRIEWPSRSDAEDENVRSRGSPVSLKRRRRFSRKARPVLGHRIRITALASGHSGTGKSRAIRHAHHIDVLGVPRALDGPSRRYVSLGSLLGQVPGAARTPHLL